MQLYIARLCLDCNEVHDSQTCPVCGSEAFAYLKKWVPVSERRVQPRPPTSPDAEVYRELIAPTPRARGSRLLKTGALGFGILAAAGWLLQKNAGRKNDTSDQ